MLKSTPYFFFALIIILVLSNLTSLQAHAAPYTPQTPAVSSMLQFAANGYTLGFAPQKMYTVSSQHAFYVDFLGANNIQPQSNPDAGSTSELTALNQVSYKNLWSGITLDYTARADSIYMTTYTLAPGANVKDIRLRYNKPLVLNKNGALTISFETGSMTESAPIAWQVIDGKRVSVDVSFQVVAQEVGFSLGAYNRNYSLIIDPVLTWTSFIGGSASDESGSIAVDDDGNIYVTGRSSASWGSPVQEYTSNDAFVAKLNPAGNLVWNTFLGGYSAGNSIVVDSAGNVYVAGDSNASWGSPVRAYGGNTDTFVARLDSNGNLIWNTFLGAGGGSNGDNGYGITMDGSGNTYVTGASRATWGSPIRPYTSNTDAYVAKLDGSGNLIWNTFLGGNSVDGDGGYGIEFYNGNVYVVGSSSGTWGSPVRAYHSGVDGFIAKLDISGTLLWNTFVGGPGNNSMITIAIDNSGNSYVSGLSNTTWGSPVMAFNGSNDISLAKVDASGNLIWNTFLGGSGNDYSTVVAVDSDGNPYVTGFSSASWGSPIRAYTAGFDGYVARLDPSGNLTGNTFLGGNGDDEAESIALDGEANIYVTGYSNASWGNPINPYTANYDGFVAKVFLTPSVNSISRVNFNPTSAATVDFTVTFSVPVTGVDAGDFSLTTSGVSSASITNVSGSGTSRTVSVSTGTGNGTIRLDVLANATISDAVGNLLTNLPYTSGEVYTIDEFAPTPTKTVTLTSTPTITVTPTVTSTRTITPTVTLTLTPTITMTRTITLTPSSTSTFPPGATPIVKQFQLGQSSDDAGASASCIASTTGNEIYIGKCDNGSGITSGFVFANISIPRGAQIVDASIQWKVDGLYANEINVAFYGEASGSAQTFSAGSLPDSRPLTSALVNWSIPPSSTWAAGGTRTSPSLATIIEEIVNQPDWNSGNRLAIIIKDASDLGAPNNHRRMYAYEREGIGSAAKLTVSYVSLNGSETVTPTITLTKTPTATRTPTPTRTATPSSTATSTSTNTSTPTVTDVVTLTLTNTATETSAATDTPTSLPTNTETITPTDTVTSTMTATITQTETSTFTPTPTSSPTNTKTSTPTDTFTPTITVTITPTATATSSPTRTKTSTPTKTITKTVTPSLTTLTLTSSNTQDGWILETSENSGVGGTLNTTANILNLGDDIAKKQYLSILSFNTAVLPDNAVITTVTLKIQKQSVLGGGNPFAIFQGLMVDIRKGFFGSAATLQTADFQATANGIYGPFSPVLANTTYTINLTSGRANINKLSSSSGLTQLRLRFKLDDNNNTIANSLSLYSGNAPTANRPQLVIKYYVP